jgi:hypothetical protein
MHQIKHTSLCHRHLLQLHATEFQKQVVLMLSVPALHALTSAHASAAATWVPDMHTVLGTRVWFQCSSAFWTAALY